MISYYSLPEKHKQVVHYNLAFQEVDSKWLIVCDLDEIAYGSKQNLSNTLKGMEDYDYIFMDWLMFGSANEHPEDIRTIVYRQKDPVIHRKYIFKTEIVDKHSDPVEVHSLKNHKEQVNVTSSDFIKLNHYPIQSLEYFQKVKMTRGDVASQGWENIRDMNYFQSYDKDATYLDDTLKNLIDKYPGSY